MSPKPNICEDHQDVMLSISSIDLRLTEGDTRMKRMEDTLDSLHTAIVGPADGSRCGMVARVETLSRDMEELKAARKQLGTRAWELIKLPLAAIAGGVISRWI